MSEPYRWFFHSPYPEQSAFLARLAAELAPAFGAQFAAARHDGRFLLRAEFHGEPLAAEDRAREYWLELQSRCIDHNLALEFTDPPSAVSWQPVEDVLQTLSASAATGETLLPALSAPQPESALAPIRPEIPSDTVYDLLRADDPDLDRNLDETIAWVEGNGMPVINLLSYLDLPLYANYTAEHPDERDQSLFLHMLHTWTCFRRFGAVSAALPEELARGFANPMYLRLNTTQFRSPAPALCVQLPPWSFAVRGIRASRGAAALPRWAKEIYLTHLEPPTPADDRELTFMIVTYDERGEYGFIPLEIPLSLPAVGQSLEAFFAPSAGDEELGANTEDLHRLTAVAATYCLYATARDPARYLARAD